MRRISLRDDYTKMGLPYSQKFQNIAIWNTLFKKIRDKILDGHDIILPFRIGILSIKGRKRDLINEDRGLPVNWPETKKLWESCPDCKERKQFVFYMNEHTGFIQYRWHWQQAGSYLRGIHMFRFKPTYGNKKLLAQKIYDGQEYQNVRKRS